MDDLFLVIGMKYIKFWWDNGKEYVIVAFPESVENYLIRALIDEYRETDPEGYNIGDFIDFLHKHGIEAEIVEIDECIYF